MPPSAQEALGQDGAKEARAFVDAENIFRYEQFVPGGEYGAHLVDLEDTLENESEPPLGEAEYLEYKGIVYWKPSLKVVPKIADHLMGWLDRTFDFQRGFVFGKRSDPGVRACRWRFASREDWEYTDSGLGEDAADDDLVSELEQTVKRTRGGAIIVASSDAKTYLKDGKPGPISEAIQIVESAQRRRPVSFELVVVLAAAARSPKNSRWKDSSDLGRADTVHRLSEIVAASLADRRANPAFRPRQNMKPDKREFEASRTRARKAFEESAHKPENDARNCIAQWLGDPTGQRFRARWLAFEDALLWLRPENRRYLLSLATPLVESYVNRPSHPSAGVATMPVASLHAAPKDADGLDTGGDVE